MTCGWRRADARSDLEILGLELRGRGRPGERAADRDRAADRAAYEMSLRPKMASSCGAAMVGSVTATVSGVAIAPRGSAISARERERQLRRDVDADRPAPSSRGPRRSSRDRRSATRHARSIGRASGPPCSLCTSTTSFAELAPAGTSIAKSSLPRSALSWPSVSHSAGSSVISSSATCAPLNAPRPSSRQPSGPNGRLGVAAVAVTCTPARPATFASACTVRSAPPCCASSTCADSAPIASTSGAVSLRDVDRSPAMSVAVISSFASSAPETPARVRERRGLAEVAVHGELALVQRARATASPSRRGRRASRGRVEIERELRAAGVRERSARPRRP